MKNSVAIGTGSVEVKEIKEGSKSKNKKENEKKCMISKSKVFILYTENIINFLQIH